MTATYPTLSLTVPDAAWTACGDEAHPDYEVRDGRLLAALVVRVGAASVNVHLEALPVMVASDGTQVGADAVSNGRLAALQAEYDTGFETIEITRNGQTWDYVLVAVPHGF